MAGKIKSTCTVLEENVASKYYHFETKDIEFFFLIEAVCL